MAYFKTPTIKTKPRKKISIQGLSELSVFFGIEKIIIYFNFWMWWTLLKKLYSELFSHRTAPKIAQLENISRALTYLTVVRKTASSIVFKVSPIVCKLTAFGKADLNLFKRRWP